VPIEKGCFVYLGIPKEVDVSKVDITKDVEVSGMLIDENGEIS
jgi:hypothetical protein